MWRAFAIATVVALVPQHLTYFTQLLAYPLTALFLIVTGVLVWAGDRIASRLAPGSLVAPLLVAFAPFAAAAIAWLPALVLAAPLALLRRADPT